MSPQRRRGLLLALVVGAAFALTHNTTSAEGPDTVVQGVVANATQTRVTLRVDTKMVTLRVDRDTRVTVNGRGAKSRDLKPEDLAIAEVERGGRFEPVALRIDARRAGF